MGFEKSNAPTTYRLRALKEHGSHCAMCGYGLYVDMLDVHHIDGNRKNGNIENLEVLCVHCHSIVTRKVPWHKWDGADFK